MISGRSSRRILGVRVDDVTYEESVEVCREIVERGKPRQAVTVNPEFVMMAQGNSRFRDVLNASALAVPDGVGLRWACKLAGAPIREIVHGIDLVEHLAAAGAMSGWRFFLLGAKEGVAARTAEILQRRYPGLRISGTYSGSSSQDHDRETIGKILDAGSTDVLLVAYGAPAQDLWIARNQNVLGIPLAIGVGGSFDYLSGEVQRAPQWIVRVGFEWLYRLIRQPWRWKRQTALVRFVLTVAYRQFRDKDGVIDDGPNTK